MSEILAGDVAEVFDHKPYIVPYGIVVNHNDDDQERRDQTKGKNKGIPVVLYLSNYIRSKGVLDLIDALKIIYEQGIDFRARLVGAPGDLSIEELKENLRRHGLEKVIEVVGPRYNSDKFTEYENADIFVFPTYYRNEAFPVVNLEAMQFGLPIISTTEGGIPDMLKDGESGYVITSQQPAQLASMISTLLKDEELRISMGRSNRQRFKNYFTLDHFLTNIHKVFDDILIRK